MPARVSRAMLSSCSRGTIVLGCNCRSSHCVPMSTLKCRCTAIVTCDVSEFFKWLHYLVLHWIHLVADRCSGCVTCRPRVWCKLIRFILRVGRGCVVCCDVVTEAELTHVPVACCCCLVLLSPGLAAMASTRSVISLSFDLTIGPGSGLALASVDDLILPLAMAAASTHRYIAKSLGGDICSNHGRATWSARHDVPSRMPAAVTRERI